MPRDVNAFQKKSPNLQFNLKFTFHQKSTYISTLSTLIPQSWVAPSKTVCNDDNDNDAIIKQDGKSGRMSNLHCICTSKDLNSSQTYISEKSDQMLDPTPSNTIQYHPIQSNSPPLNASMFSVSQLYLSMVLHLGQSVSECLRTDALTVNGTQTFFLFHSHFSFTFLFLLFFPEMPLSIVLKFITTRP